MPSSYLILGRPLLLLPPIPHSIRVFSNESTLRMRWPKYWSFSFSIILSKEIPVLISFRMDWLDLLEVQGTLKSLLQHHSSKTSILWCSAFPVVYLLSINLNPGKSHHLTWVFSFHRFSSIKFSHSVVSDSLWPHGLQDTRLPYPSPTQSLLRLMSIELVMPSKHLILYRPSPPAFNLSQHQGLFKWVSSSHQVAIVLEFQLQHQSFQWTARTDLL